MGKFDGVLLLSDFDNTLVYTEDALLSGGRLPPLNSANREAIHYFMAEGGIFSVATGRALPSFAPIAPTPVSYTHLGYLYRLHCAAH